MKNKNPSLKTAPAPKKFSGQTLFLWGAILAFLAVAWLMLFHDGGGNNHAEAAGSRFKLEDIPFNGKQAYEYLKQLCEIGPRPSGSKGMESQQEMLEEHFKKFGGQVEYQRFQAPHPEDGTPVPMANMIVQLASRGDRIGFCFAPITTRCPCR